MKRRKIIAILLFLLIFCNAKVYAKYAYHIDETVIELTRDTNAPSCNVTYSTEEWTNGNVIITITSNKEIEQVSGFTLSEDKKVLTKEVSQNEYGIIKIRDFSGNITEVEYNVSNIDKEAPQIIGCQNGGIYDKPLALDYSDNVEIKNIYVDRYDDALTLDYANSYLDSFYYYGVDRTNSTLTIRVTSHPKNTRKYKYYANNKLYATTTDTSYTFTGLNKGTTYELKVQAIDELGNILEEKTQTGYTSFYESITSTKANNKFSATLNHLDSSVKKIRYAIWNYYVPADVRWYEIDVTNQTAVIEGTHFNTNYHGSYVIHAYMYDSNNHELDVLGFSFDFTTNYKPTNPKIDPYNLTQSGNYQIIVSDLAGNETLYEIKVK